MARSLQVRLDDITGAIAGIDAIIDGVDFQTFTQSWPMQRAVERGLEIISDATRGIPDDRKLEHPEVLWMQIAGIGNILRHEDRPVEPVIVWNITQTHLPNLGQAVRRMLPN